MTEPELIEKMAEGAFGDDYRAMKAEALIYMGQPNGHSAWKEVEAMRAQMSAALAAIRESGREVVPVEPTPDMLTNVGTITGWNEAAPKNADECHVDWWKAMIAASKGE
jgi:hypothetical protein